MNKFRGALRPTATAVATMLAAVVLTSTTKTADAQMSSAPAYSGSGYSAPGYPAPAYSPPAYQTPSTMAPMVPPPMSSPMAGPAPMGMPMAGPPMGGEAAAIQHCICEQRAMTPLGADMNARMSQLNQIRQEVAALDEQLRTMRGQIDVNDPAAVSRYKQLLERRDNAFHRSTGGAAAEARTATQRYNVAVNDYNAQCANRPFNSVMMSQMQAGPLSCPSY